MEQVRPARELEPEKEEGDVKRVQAARPDKAEVWEEARDKAGKNDFDNGLFTMEVLRC